MLRLKNLNAVTKRPNGSDRGQVWRVHGLKCVKSKNIFFTLLVSIIKLGITEQKFKRIYLASAKL